MSETEITITIIVIIVVLAGGAAFFWFAKSPSPAIAPARIGVLSTPATAPASRATPTTLPAMRSPTTVRPTGTKELPASPDAPPTEAGEQPAP